MKNLIVHVVQTKDGLGDLILRLPLGVIFLAHGAQKLFGWFGGYGLEGTGQYMASIGLNPGTLMAFLAGSAEFFGGLALILGLLIRPASVVLAFTMLVAILSVHIGNGLFLSNDGIEFGLVLLAGTLFLALSGAGKVSVDQLIAQRIRDSQSQ